MIVSRAILYNSTITSTSSLATASKSSHSNRHKRSDSPTVSIYDQPEVIFVGGDQEEERRLNISQETKLVALTVSWSMLNAVHVVFQKSLLSMYPYPFSWSVMLLGTNSTLHVLLWCSGVRESPDFSRIRWRHVRRLAVSGWFHAAAMVMSHYAVFVGTASAAVVIRTAQMAAPDTTWAFVLLCLGGVLSAHSIKQWLYGVGANLLLTARSQTRFHPKRFGGPQSLFGLVTIVSFVSLLPVALYMEGTQLFSGQSAPSLLWLHAVVGYAFTYVGANELTYAVFRGRGFRPEQQRLSDIVRRVITFVVTAFTFDEEIHWDGALLALFGLFLVRSSAKTTSLPRPHGARRQRSDSDSHSIASMRAAFQQMHQEPPTIKEE